MKRIIIITCFGLLLVIGAQFTLAAMTSNNYQIWADVISTGGGEDAVSTNYNLQDTLGEQAIGRASSTNYTTRIGFREMDYFRGDEVLTLTVDSASLALGALSTTQTKSAAHTLTVDTNSYSGVSVTYSGSTLACSGCSGTNTITAIGATAAAAAVGASQFGFNAIYSSGASPSASSVSPYNDNSKYAFNSGDQIISSTGQINATVFNLTYIANISGSETAGTYLTTVTYTATANF